MKSFVLVALLTLSHSASAIYMMDGEFLFDGKTLMISRQTLTQTTKSGIKDAVGFRKYIQQGQTGGVLEKACKASPLVAVCKDSDLTISIYSLAGFRHFANFAVKIESKNAVFYRISNSRQDQTTFHIESIENFANPFEGASSSGGQSDDLVTLNCK